jgi:hypothetical protein
MIINITVFRAVVARTSGDRCRGFVTRGVGYQLVGLAEKYHGLGLDVDFT